METSIDLYAEECANDYVDVSDENPEEETENQAEGNEQENAENNEPETAEDEEKKKVKPKRLIRNPRPKLNVETLKSKKGLLCLEGYFKNKQFKGRGHAEEDLRTVMKTYEYWCHRLFPKMSFDDCIEKIEKLGTKKQMQAYLKRIRMDLIFDEDQVVRNDQEDEPLNDVSLPQFDDLLPQEDAMEVEEPVELTEEQLERIHLNKEKANRLRQERLQRDNTHTSGNTSQNVELDSAVIEEDNILNSSQVSGVED